MMKKPPTECPKCGHATLQIEVIAWAQFSSGSFDLLDSDPGYEFLDNPTAHCVECGHEWTPR